MTTTYKPMPSDPPLAEDATMATRNAGPCAICQRAITTYQRYASLVPTGRLAHLACIAARATPRTRVPAIW